MLLGYPWRKKRLTLTAPTARGFTLLEVLVALTILAIALTAISMAISVNARNANYIDNKIAAHWVAMNTLAHYQLLANQPNFSAQSSNNGTSNLLGRTWYWQANIANTMVPNNYRIEVNVSISAKAKPLATLNGFLYHGATNENS